MNGPIRDIVRQKLVDALTFELPSLTRREAKVPAIPGKAHSIIGMRRAGKTWFLYQCLQDRLERGAPRESLVYFDFEDERLNGLETAQLAWVLEEYFVRFPEFRDQREVTFFFDEIQVVPGWERFIRRILGSEKLEVFLSGSSARLLSREIATAMRGRATETVIFPFSFHEYLRHHGMESPGDPTFVPKTKRSSLERAFQDYLRCGGFPEAQGLTDRDRISLLQGYVDTVVFRDVVERHGVSNIIALRRLVRQLLGNAAGHFSVHRLYNDLRSQGVSVGKDALHQMLAHLEDAFLVRLVPLATTSERQRQSNPRKVYPIDPAIIQAFDRSAKANVGHLLETVVLIELERRSCEIGYVATPHGYEVDFLATTLEGGQVLLQAAADLSDKAVREREFRALADSMPHNPRAQAVLLTMTTSDALEAQPEAPTGVRVRPAWEWLLESTS
jgi:predicted AAA+ superfamily ATPase